MTRWGPRTGGTGKLVLQFRLLTWPEFTAVQERLAKVGLRNPVTASGRNFVCSYCDQLLVIEKKKRHWKRHRSRLWEFMQFTGLDRYYLIDKESLLVIDRQTGKPASLRQNLVHYGVRASMVQGGLCSGVARNKGKGRIESF